MVRRKTFPVLRRTTPTDPNRLTTINYSTRTVTYSYDPLNNVTRATNENGSVYIGYDNRYRVSSFSDPFYYGISYNYDTVGNRTALKVNGATYATYTYDTVNRLTTLKDSVNLAFNYNYDAANRLSSRSAPNGVTSSYAYDGLDRLTSLMHTAGATTLSGNLYTYNDANNISSWTTQTTQKGYTYDAADRLTNVTNFEAPAENYSYDAVGNRTASHLSAAYGYQPFNRLASTTSATYSSDNNGNLTSKTDTSGTTTYTFNEENQLTQVALPNGLTVNYKYDGVGRRIQRTTSTGADERYISDYYDALIDLNPDWSPATTYLSALGSDKHLRQTNVNSGVTYFLLDHLGSTGALTDAAGNLLEQSAYDSFGNNGGSNRTRYGFTGRERDSDTGMLYYRARFFDPTIGRFASEDPLQFRGKDVNLYSYVGNNPLNYVDPFGFERLRYTMVPGKPPPPLPPPNPVRLPDFGSFQINLGPPGSPLGWSGQIILDRHGHFYIQPLGYNLGKSFPAGFSVALTAGWINQRCEPSEQKLRDVLSDQSIGVGGGYIGGIEFTGNKSGSTTQIGLMSPQIGGNWGYTLPWKDTGLEESHFSLECGCPPPQ